MLLELVHPDFEEKQVRMVTESFPKDPGPFYILEANWQSFIHVCNVTRVFLLLHQMETSRLQMRSASRSEHYLGVSQPNQWQEQGGTLNSGSGGSMVLFH